MSAILLPFLNRPGHGRKVCPKCHALMHSKQMLCECGYSFVIKDTLESYFGLAEQIASKFTTGLDVRDTDEFGDACLALFEAHQSYNRTIPFAVWARRIIHQKLIASYRAKRRQKRWLQESHLNLDAIPIDDNSANVLDAKILVEMFLTGFDGDKEDKINRDIIIQWMNGVSLKSLACRKRKSMEWIRRHLARGMKTIRTRYRQQLKDFE